MAKKSAIEKNNLRQKLSVDFKKKRSELKAVLMNKETSPEERFKTQLQMALLPRNSSPVRYRNRCALSGRPRGNYRKFNVSRIAFRDLALDGHLPGVVKASW